METAKKSIGVLVVDGDEDDFIVIRDMLSEVPNPRGMGKAGTAECWISIRRGYSS